MADQHLGEVVVVPVDEQRETRMAGLDSEQVLQSREVVGTGEEEDAPAEVEIRGAHAWRGAQLAGH
jgi:hypothetical protein